LNNIFDSPLVKGFRKRKKAYHEWPHPADTASPHSQKVERRRQHGYTIIIFKNKTPQTINKNENLRGYRLVKVSCNTICHWGFKPGSKEHQSHTCLNRFPYQQTRTNCFREVK
jgi:hypothetical protein